MPASPLRWEKGELFLLDQTRLPEACVEINPRTLESVREAIRALRVRGAPAIGLCAAFGVLIGLREKTPRTVADALEAVRESAAFLATARPTAVNLFKSLDDMKTVAEAAVNERTVEAFTARMEAAAVRMLDEDLCIGRAIGEHGAPLIRDGDGVLTHCNAGALATGGYGTALAVMYRAQELGTRFHVFADETRPLLQGARLTAWELARAGIDVTLICDNMAAQVMREGRVQLAVVGADRIAANGDTANKIGTYGVALLCRAHGIPFYVAAPLSTIDPATPGGDDIPIEQRAPEEVTEVFGKRTAPDGVKVYNPAFDVTPAGLIAGIITERGILRPPYEASIADVLKP